jgi:uncharacterized protein (DUF1015 family)
LRPRREYVGDVASLPYDVLSIGEARKIAQNNPLSFLHVEKSEIDVPDPDQAYNKHTYETARRNLETLINKKIIFQEETACYYVYRQRMGSDEQHGIVGGISIDEYLSSRLKKHEQTRTDKELDRTMHIDMVNAQTGPVFVAYKARQEIDRLVGKITAAYQAEYDFVSDDGITHTVWLIDRHEDIETLREAFARIQFLYIADGHHRAAAAVTVGKNRRAQNPGSNDDKLYDYIMAVLFPHDQLKIMAYNRVVKDLDEMDETAFLRRIEGPFHVTKNFSQKCPERFHEFGMYLSGQWYKLTMNEICSEGQNPAENLDVSILQNHLLKPILQIDDPKTDKRIDFVGGIRGVEELEKLVDSGEFVVAFSLYPTTLDQLMAVADTGKMMPPKSTWFEPKLRSGIFVYPLWE